jgi:osmotically inducible lipoprotein OsmB
MKTMQRFTVGAVAVALLLGVGGCSGMSTRDRDTAIGAGIGGVAGYAITDGSAVGTIGGAAVGGLIGNQIGKDKK